MTEANDPNKLDLPDRVEASYSDNRWLRAAVALIPGVGGSLDALITARASTLARRRIEALLQELHTAIERLGQTKVDRVFVGCEEWDDLVIRAFRAAAETRHREKIRAYAAILAGAAAADHDPELDAEALLATVADLTALNLAVARALHARLSRAATPEEATQNELQRWWARTGEDWAPPAARRDLTFHLKRLESAGLITELTGSYFDYQGGAYRMTVTFEKLMRLVTDVAREASTAKDEGAGVEPT